MYKTVIVKPIITEKSSLISVNNKYVFQVSTNVNKIEIRNAIERLFNVKVTGVNTLNVKGKNPCSPSFDILNFETTFLFLMIFEKSEYK